MRGKEEWCWVEGALRRIGGGGGRWGWGLGGGGMTMMMMMVPALVVLMMMMMSGELIMIMMDYGPALGTHVCIVHAVYDVVHVRDIW